MRHLLDTNIYVYVVSDVDSLTNDVRAIIIAQAISHRMTLISSDTKFPFYRKQGLDLIVNY